MTLDVYRGRKTRIQQQQIPCTVNLLLSYIIQQFIFDLLHVVCKVAMGSVFQCNFYTRWGMTRELTSFSTAYQSYQDDGQMIIKGCVQLNRVSG